MADSPISQFQPESADSGPAFASGSVIDGRYEIIARLGIGGFGTVFKAKHLQLDRLVALKILHSRFIADPAAVKRFQQEAQAVSLLKHPNIISVIAFGVFEGVPYMVSEYLPGGTLLDLLDDYHVLRTDRAIPIFLEICAGLAHAHGKGVIHRDLKPGNVMLVQEPTKSEVIKILDFGLAKICPEAGLALQHLTQTGTVLGDPRYMSPEQCQALPLDARSDIYSFGCLMYEVLTSNTPFTAENAVTMMYMHLTEDAEPFAWKNSAITGGLEDIVLKALERDPDSRWQSADELSGALRKELSDIEQGNVKKVSRKPRRAWRWTRKRTPAAYVVGLSLAFAAAGLSWAVYQNMNSDRDTAPGAGPNQFVDLEGIRVRVRKVIYDNRQANYREDYHTKSSQLLAAVAEARALPDPLLELQATNDLSSNYERTANKLPEGAERKALLVQRERLLLTGLEDAQRALRTRPPNSRELNRAVLWAALTLCYYYTDYTQLEKGNAIGKVGLEALHNGPQDMDHLQRGVFLLSQYSIIQMARQKDEEAIALIREYLALQKQLGSSQKEIYDGLDGLFEQSRLHRSRKAEMYIRELLGKLPGH